MSSFRRQRLWVLSELYYPEDSATGYYITKTAEALAEMLPVSVLCAQPTYRARGIKAPADEVVAKVHIHRCAATTLDKDILLFRLVNLLTISVSLFFNALWKIRQGDVVLVVTNPPTLPFVVSLACRLRRARLILRVEDVYPEVLIAAGLIDRSSVVVRMLDGMHRLLYRKVDRILVLGRDMYRLVASKVTDNPQKISIITNWADTEEITAEPRSENSLLRKLGLAEKFVLQYSGNMGRTHDLEVIVECARLLQRDQRMHFLFIGSGAKEPWLRETVAQEGLNNVTVLPPQPRAQLRESLNACDVAVVSFVKGMSGVSVPSRMYNVLAAGKPVLAVVDPGSELAQVIGEREVGWIVSPGDAAGMMNIATKAATGSYDLTAKSQRARALAVEQYPQSQIMTRLKIVLREFVALEDPGMGGRR